MNNIQATISASPARRGVAILFMAVLGAMLIYLAINSSSGSFFWRAFLLLSGIVMLFGAQKLRGATLVTIELHEDRVVDSNGTELCRMDNIKSVERGAFAFKPSNGFLIRLNKPLPRAWAPGLWWRFGRSVGVGGVTPASQAKFMSEMIALRLAQN